MNPATLAIELRKVDAGIPTDQKSKPLPKLRSHRAVYANMATVGANDFNDDDFDYD